MQSGEDVTIRNYIVLFNDVDIMKRIKINRLKWAGHVLRREHEEITKGLMTV
jgi:hypothetical protein